MAKKRFPSPANQPKGGAPAAKAAAGPLPEAVSATSQKTVQVEYKKDNNHILGLGAHALAKGINTLPAHVWEEAKKHPSVQSLIKAGHIVDRSSKAEAAPAEEAEESSDESEGSEEASEGQEQAE